jgi:hypothetical protein
MPAIFSTQRASQQQQLTRTADQKNGQKRNRGERCKTSRKKKKATERESRYRMEDGERKAVRKKGFLPPTPAPLRRHTSQPPHDGARQREGEGGRGGKLEKLK